MRNGIRNLAVMGVLMVSTAAVSAGDLDLSSAYRTKVNVAVFTDSSACRPPAVAAAGAAAPAPPTPLNVGAQSRLRVIDSSEAAYTVVFEVIYKVGRLMTTQELKAANEQDDAEDFTAYELSDVVREEPYYLCRKLSDGSAIESRLAQAHGGVVSGPLIVPFKYRLDDKSMDGSATVGYYAGYGFEIGRDVFNTLEPIVLSPFISAGVTQITVEEIDAQGERKSESKSGFSLAVGILLNNWDGLNIGLVVGQDRIGDDEYTHEGETWVSFSVGWDI